MEEKIADELKLIKYSTTSILSRLELNMFNYQNLNDVEFENLCKDIMENILAVGLRIFSQGRDGGIDLTDSVITHNIVIQVKHYINSKFANLKTSLEKEIVKVKEINPNQYYICCGMNLTDKNIKEIYNMFLDYMESDKNIITLKEIDEFLQNSENIKVVRKHYKLWLYASNILSEIHNQDIFIDCESLLSDIEEDCKNFVQTVSYDECLKCLETNRIVMMIGAPGVGKTITSKMLVFYFANQGYRVRYTTNGNIADVKRSLSSDSNCKEIVLLDDCLGQHYFNMKDTQENELISLIKYIKVNPNKMLILNSRITIYNEAKERSEEFKMFLLGDKIKIHTINMDLISAVEKAKIFYNHLVFKNVPKEYYNNIRKDKRYLKIVNHPNYTPRIIEYITTQARYSGINPEEFCDYIFETLSQPDDIWKNEFERRLKDTDRAFMSTLYSLTDTSIDCEIFRACYINRLTQMNGIDNTVDYYETTLTRLNGSLIIVFAYRGKKHIGVINPSVNDYLKSVFQKNILELSAVREASKYFVQMKRCYSDKEYEALIRKSMKSGSILNVLFNNEYEKEKFIVSMICKLKVENELYKSTLTKYLNRDRVNIVNIEDLMSKNEIIACLIKDPLCSFYGFADIVCSEMIVNNMLSNMVIEELVDSIESIFSLMQRKNIDEENLDWFVPLCCEKTIEAIEEYVDSIEASTYYEDYDINDIFKQNHCHESGYDEDGAVDTIIELVKSDIKDGLDDIICRLSPIFRDEIKVQPVSINVNRSEIEGVIKSYFEPDSDDYDDYRQGYDGGKNISEIDAIFDRE